MRTRVGESTCRGGIQRTAIGEKGRVARDRVREHVKG